MIKLSNLLKELEKTDKKSLMGIGNYNTQGEKDFNRHHAGSMYGDFMGNIADTDTTDFDDEEADKNPGKVEPYNPKKDKVNRGYEPINSPFSIVNEMENPCWKGYEMVGTKKKNGKEVPNCVPMKEFDMSQFDEIKVLSKEEFYEDINSDDDVNYGLVEPEEYDVEDEDMADFISFMRGYDKSLNEGCQCLREAEYQGRQVQLGKPMQGDVKKFKVYVKNPAGNVVKVNFGQKGMKIRKSNPAARKSFRARMNCDNPGPRHKANYWSCRKW